MLRNKYNVSKGAHATCKELIWPILLQEIQSVYYSDFLQGRQKRRDAVGYCRQLGALTMEQRDLIRSIVREYVFTPEYANNWLEIKQEIGGTNAAFDLTYIILPYIVVVKMLEMWAIGGMTVEQANAFLQLTSDETLQVFDGANDPLELSSESLSDDDSSHSNAVQISKKSNEDTDWSVYTNVKIVLLP